MAAQPNAGTTLEHSSLVNTGAKYVGSVVIAAAFKAARFYYRDVVMLSSRSC